MILVAVLLLTPIGGRSVAVFGWSAAAGDSGLELSIDSVSGSLVRGVVFEGVRVTTEDGTQIVQADSIAARVGAQLGCWYAWVKLRPFLASLSTLGVW